MSLLDSVDAYCERTDGSFWSEPLNAATNIGFLIAAVLLWNAIAKARTSGASIALSVESLPWLVALIGLCSFLFHTLAIVWAGLVDSLSILVFACVSLYAFLRHAAAIQSRVAIAATACFAIASGLAPAVLPAGALNHSSAYLPYLAGLIGVTVYLHIAGRPGWRVFAVCTLLFCISLILRSIDLSVCSRFPLGTHFLWHLLNATLLFLLSRELIHAARPCAR